MNVIKKAILLGFAVIILRNTCVTVEKLPAGYESAQWGASIDNVQQIITFYPISACDSPDKNFKTIFVLAPDEDKRGSITYYFYQDKLYLVEVELRHAAEAVLNELKEQYGKPVEERKASKDRSGKYLSTAWRDALTEIVYKETYPYKEGSWKNKMFYSSRSIMAEIEKREAQKKIQYRTKIKSK